MKFRLAGRAALVTCNRIEFDAQLIAVWPCSKKSSPAGCGLHGPDYPSPPDFSKAEGNCRYEPGA